MTEENYHDKMKRREQEHEIVRRTYDKRMEKIMERAHARLNQIAGEMAEALVDTPMPSNIALASYDDSPTVQNYSVLAQLDYHMKVNRFLMGLLLPETTDQQRTQIVNQLRTMLKEPKS